MNVSETRRQAIGIAEAVCRLTWVGLVQAGNVSFEVTPIDTEPGTLPHLKHQNFEVEITRFGRIHAALEVTIVHDHREGLGWHMAFVEYITRGSMTVPPQLFARRVDGLWTVHNAQHVARSADYVADALSWSDEWKLEGKVPTRAASR